jgi:hypothetical protein
MFYRVHLAWAGFELTTSVVMGTDCTGSYKSNYCKTTTAPQMGSNIYRTHKGKKNSIKRQTTAFESSGNGNRLL